MDFVSLHSHTTFSYMDGYGRPLAHFERAAELGMSALVLTEHGNTSSHVEGEKASLKTGVRFIPGLEAYTATQPSSTRKFHMTIIAMDASGYASLNGLVTASWVNFYRWPTVDGQMLSDYSDGLIVLSGCSDSLLSCSLLGGKSIEPADASWERAVSVARRLKEVLGDRFYLEVQQFPELERTCQLNPAFERMGKLLRIPLAATADVHTIRPGQHEIRALLHAAGRGNNTIAAQLSSWEYEVPDYYPESDDFVVKRLERTGLSPKAARTAVANTAVVADRCHVTLPKAERFRFAGTTADLEWR